MIPYSPATAYWGHVYDAMQKSLGHPSVLEIKERAFNNKRFEFSSVDPSLVFSKINYLDPSEKASGAVPTNKLKLASNAYYREITYRIKNPINTNTFPDILKLADVTPIFKKGENSIIENFHPISLLSSFPKIYGRVLSQQILPFMIPKFSNLICAFRECYSHQHALIRFVEQCRTSLDNRGI